MERKAFYESVGLYGRSYIHSLISDNDRNTLIPNELQTTSLPSEYFGEGLAPRSAHEFALLTYKKRMIFTIDRRSMRLLNQTFRVPNELVEGWGMTADQSNVNRNGYY